MTEFQKDLAISLADIHTAQRRIEGVAKRTSLVRSTTLGKFAGCEIYLKPECFQLSGSFKIRGAANRIAALSPQEGKRGVVTGSSGNHGQALACAASLKGYPCIVIMPEGGSPAKAEAIRGYGAELIFHGTTSDARLDLAAKLAAEKGMTFVPSYNDPYIMAGQGTMGLEILEDLPDVNAVLVPTGGCGLISGVATAVKETSPGVKIFGVEPLGSNSTTLSFRAGKRERLETTRSIADGVLTSVPGDLTFPVVQRYVDDMIEVSEEAIADAVRLILERCKILAEPTGALTTAAALTCLPQSLKGKKVVLVVSGGNVALKELAKILASA